MFVIDLPAALVLVALIVLLAGVAIYAAAKAYKARTGAVYREQAVTLIEALLKEPTNASAAHDQLMNQLFELEKKAPGKVSEAFDELTRLLNAAFGAALLGANTDRIPALNHTHAKLGKLNASFHRATAQ